MRFFEACGIYRSDVAKVKVKIKTKTPGSGPLPPPAGSAPTQVKENAAGEPRLFSSSAMSSGRLFLDRVARQHCPSPLHRRPQINMHFSDAQD